MYIDAWESPPRRCLLSEDEFEGGAGEYAAKQTWGQGGEMAACPEKQRIVTMNIEMEDGT